MAVRLAEIVAASGRVAEASGRLAKIAHLADCVRAAGPDAARTAVGLLTGLPRQGRLGIGYALLRSARAEPPAASASLTLAELDAALDRFGEIKGKGAAAERLRLLRDLFARATAAEQDFLVRLLVGELRQGALEGVMVEAIARAAGLPGSDVRRAAMVAGDLGVVAASALGEGAFGLARFAVQLFRPVQPMLAQPAEDAADALARLGEAAFEWKLDGARIQVHKRGGEVRIFSRQLNEVTGAVPEIVEAALALPARELILDGEAIALRPDGRPQPFQVTMRRFGRKLEIEALRQALPLRCFFFDVLALEGVTLLDQPARARFAALSDALPDELRIPRIVTDRLEAAEAFITGALEQGHEGAMAKALDAPYQAGGRGRGWLKVKQAQTLDLAILAAEWGHGRRRGMLSNLHLGAYDPAANGFVMLGKTFKGLTDQMLAWQTERLLALAIGRDAHVVHVRPELLVEIAYSDLQASPHYPGGMALRFARVKAYRTDKRPEQADTIATVRARFAQQTGDA